jgi:hypothetical protein
MSYSQTLVSADSINGWAGRPSCSSAPDLVRTRGSDVGPRFSRIAITRSVDVRLAVGALCICNHALSGAEGGRTRIWRIARRSRTARPHVPSHACGCALLTGLAWLPLSDSSSQRSGSRGRGGGSSARAAVAARPRRRARFPREAGKPPSATRCPSRAERMFRDGRPVST